LRNAHVEAILKLGGVHGGHFARGLHLTIQCGVVKRSGLRSRVMNELAIFYLTAQQLHLPSARKHITPKAHRACAHGQVIHSGVGSQGQYVGASPYGYVVARAGRSVWSPVSSSGPGGACAAVPGVGGLGLATKGN